MKLKPMPLSTAIAFAIGASSISPTQAQLFPAELEVTDLDGSNGFVLDGEADGDFAGESVSRAGDINGDGINDLIIGARGADPNGLASGRIYVVFGSDIEFPSPFKLSSVNGNNGFVLNGEMEFDYAGRSVSAAGDINGDGIDDLIIGASNATPNGLGSGRSYVVFGSENDFPNPFELSNLNGLNGIVLNGEEYDFSGRSVSAVDDINGDGIDDLIIGAEFAGPNGPSSGRSYVVFGSDTGLPSPINLSTLNGVNGFALNGEAAMDNAGSSVSAAGDVNGDGIDDLIVGAPNDSGSNPSAGRGYLVFGSSTGFSNPFNLNDLNGLNGFVMVGESIRDLSGASVSSAGDVNGDGITDIIIGAPEGDNFFFSTGRSYVVFGSDMRMPNPFNLSNLNGVNGFVLNGETRNNFSGTSVSAAGDINGDGVDDIIIGAPRADNGLKYDTGRSYVVFGSLAPFPQEIELCELNGDNGFIISGALPDEESGTSVSGAGDVNGDGIDDLIIGAPYSFVSYVDDNRGRAYVVFGRASRDLAVTKTNGSAFVETGQPTTWFIEVTNLTGANITGATLIDPVPVGVANASWTCTGFDGASCTNPSGSGSINESVDLPANASLLYEFTATVTADEPSVISNTATITLAEGQTDVNPANNSATDTDPVGLFTDGFEDEL
ncbi:MAG: hypothetical protein AAGH65_05920 [Pseudomonadota bacterium]